MAWIQPNTAVRILRGVPLDIDDENSFHFVSAQAQESAFSFYTKFALINKPDTVMYQRHNKNSIRIEKKADLLYDCNYMMFQNTEYGTKWFYAFITEVNYINDRVSEVVYELDDLQTWYFDFHLEECYVEREHQATDNIGDNLQPENIGTGELFYDGADRLFWYNPQAASANNDYHPCVVVAGPFNKLGGDSNGTVTGGMYSGLHYNIFFTYTDDQNVVHPMIDQLLDFFDRMRVATREDQIVTMFYFIKEFAVQSSSDPSSDTPLRSYYQEVKNVTRDYRGFKNNYNNLNEEYYVPHNNKLFTAPYNYITVTDWQGHGMDYCYEYFSDSQITFILNSSLSVTPAIGFIPVNYMGSTPNQGYGRNFDYSFWYSDFPRIPWITDGFVAWLAQTTAAVAGTALFYAPQIALSGASGIEALKLNGSNAAYNSMIDSANSLKSSMVDILDESGNLIGQTTAVTNKLASKRTDYKMKTGDFSPTMFNNFRIQGLLASGAVAMLRGTRIGGCAQPSPNWAISNIAVDAVHKKIRKEYAMRIDKYFDMYGYACNQVKIPNTAVRTEWTYTKTIGCHITGDLPADSAKRICQRFDSGLRLWVTPSHLGNYSDYSNNVLI